MKRIHPTDDTLQLFHGWMHQHGLGRKRLLDTMLAATYCSNGITEIISSNARNFSVFGEFRVIVP